MLDHYRDETDFWPLPISSYLLEFSISRAIIRTAEHICSLAYPPYAKHVMLKTGFETSKLLVVSMFAVKMRQFVMGEEDEVDVDIEEQD